MRQLSAKPVQSAHPANTIRSLQHGLLTFTSLFAVGLFAVGPFAVGCGAVDRIEQHVMPRERTGIPEAVRVPTAQNPAAQIPAAQNQSAQAIRSRMVTAIAPLPSATWFFKAVGPVEDMEAVLPALTSFFQSVRFDAQGRPEYSPPTIWKKGAARPGRYETLLLGPGETPSVELAISELGPN